MKILAALVVLACACAPKPAPPGDAQATAVAPPPSLPPSPARPEPAAPPSPPEGAEARAFTERFIAHVAQAHPGVKIEAVGDRSVQVAGGNPMDLANLWFECTTSPPVCDEAMDRWERVLTAPPTAMHAADLRISLFAADALGSAKVVSRPFVGPLVEVLVRNSPDQITTVSPAELAAIGLAPDAAWKTALANLRAAIPGPLIGTNMSADTSNLFIGDYPDSYGAARLLIPELWAPIAAKAGGKLLVAVPARDTIIWILHPTEKEGHGFRWLAQSMCHHEPHPISFAIFRWTPSGFVLEDANTTPIETPTAH